MENDLNLPENELKELKEKIKAHIRSLNDKSNIGVDANKIPTEVILKTLGISTDMNLESEAWLCGCDMKQCGTDN